MVKRLAARRVLVVGLMMLGLIGAFVGGAYGSHVFGDVSSGAFYHDDVTWLANSGVTSGCGNGKYCPNAAVTRGQMATFLHKFATRTRTGHFSCDAYGFHPTTSGYNWFTGTAGLYSFGPVSCGVTIPDGATITKFTTDTVDGNPANNVVCYLSRRLFGSGETTDDMALTTTSGSSGEQLLTDTTINQALVSNNAYAYYVKCYMSPDDTVATTYYGVSIEYTYPGIPAP